MDSIHTVPDPMAQDNPIDPIDPTAANAAGVSNAATDSAAGLALVVAGVSLRLLAGRAVWWPEARTLFVADVHLGKAESFSALGVPVPRGPTAATLDRLAGLIDACGATRLVVLGDLLHARQAQAPATIGLLRQWRAQHDRLQCLLVRGNHDDHAGDPPADLGIEMVTEGERLGPFSLCHVPGDSDALPSVDASAESRAGPASRPRQSQPGGYRLAGHLHPAVRLSGRGGASVRLPCFRVGESQMVLPAFGDFTGGATIARIEGERVFAIAPPQVIELPAQRSRPSSSPARRSGPGPIS
ncbi:MAG: ligase-associated DNA damage response endonuclease PdeM [Burkholderiales bacterium]|nr:ligase-associated DNA damage response endonuclease PdeM [Burkholderiales bacterium]